MTSPQSNNSSPDPALSAATSDTETRALMPTSAELEAMPEAFQGPELNPAPVPELSGFEIDVWDFLQYVDPIEDPGMLSFQVAQLTVGMGELLRELADLRATLANLVTLEDFPETIRAEIKARLERRLNDESPTHDDGQPSVLEPG